MEFITPNIYRCRGIKWLYRPTTRRKSNFFNLLLKLKLYICYWNGYHACEKVFVGIFIFSSFLDQNEQNEILIKNKIYRVKSKAKTVSHAWYQSHTYKHIFFSILHNSFDSMSIKVLYYPVFCRVIKLFTTTLQGKLREPMVKGSDRLCKVVKLCSSVVENFFRIHLRNIKLFKDL